MSTSTAPRKLVDAKTVAEYVGVHPETIKLWARRGRIPYYDGGHRTRRFDLAEVFDALRRPTESPVADRTAS